MFTKSGIMVGLGEKREEVLQLMDDLRSADVDFLTIGQYLQPTRKHAEVERFVHARRVQGAMSDRPSQRLSDGLGQPADPLLRPCRRRLREAEGGEAGFGFGLCPDAPTDCRSGQRSASRDRKKDRRFDPYDPDKVSPFRDDGGNPVGQISEVCSVSSFFRNPSDDVRLEAIFL